jgi:hypothetical protein
MELIQTNPSVATQADPSIYFTIACTELAKITAEHGYNLNAVSDRGLNKFKTLPQPQQLGIIQALEGYVLQIRSALNDKINIIGDNSKHAWWAMAKLGLRCPDDLFEKIKATDVIEIYNQDSIQIFRSFEMFQFLSYSLSDIFAHEWTDLYTRDEFVFNRMFNLVGEILSGKVTGVINPNFPPHIVEEKFSNKKCWAKMKHRFFSPLFTASGAVGGFLSAFEIIDSGSN